MNEPAAAVSHNAQRSPLLLQQGAGNFIQEEMRAFLGAGPIGERLRALRV